MTNRLFALRDHNNGTLAYDPCSGFVLLASDVAGGKGLRMIDASVAARWPIFGIVEKGLPWNICWSPIVQCNLECPHCLDDKSTSQLVRGERRRIAQLLGRAAPLGIDISGGEPLLLKELPDLIGLIQNGLTAVSVTTNGWLLSERCQELAPHVHGVRVSLDGADAKMHDHLRGSESFIRAIGGIRRAISCDVPVQIQFVAMKSTLVALPALLELARDEGVQGVTVLQLLPIGEATSMQDELCSDSEVEEALHAAEMPSGLSVRLRSRRLAAGFTVVRADGRVWRNDQAALSIGPVRRLQQVSDLAA